MHKLLSFLRRAKADGSTGAAEPMGRLLRSIIDATPDLVFVKDLECRHVMVNRATLEFTNRSEPEIIGKGNDDLLPPELAAACTRSDREPMLKGRPCRSEERFPTPRGDRVFDTVKIPLTDTLGRLTGMAGISREITDRIHAEEERRSLEQQLRQAQKLESLGHLAGGIAHDFNNILTAIIGYATILRRQTGDEGWQRRLDQIVHASDRGATLVRGLLSFSRRQSLNPRPADLNAIIHDVESLLARLVPATIELRFRLCPAPLAILADEVQIQQVVMNIVSNARDAMPEGGTVTVATEPFSMDEAFVRKRGYGQPGEYALLTVEDTGTGIGAEDLGRIFEPFFTTKGPGKGTGLGLSIAYGIVKQHGGHVGVETERGRGTVLRVYLPLTREAVLGLSPSDAAEDLRGTETVLVAEDNAAVRELVTTVLREQGYRVVETADGAEAITALGRKHDVPDLVLVDAVMPKKAWADVAAVARQASPEIPIVVMSGYSPDVVEHGGGLGNAVSFLSKPVSPRILLQTVRRALGPKVASTR